jgi:hypothetical protein
LFIAGLLLEDLTGILYEIAKPTGGFSNGSKLIMFGFVVR